ncbi:MAG: guanylate kinase [Lachnospiraceae bacterium]|nr:guanylate kinase [Lachnospiraceae bacterium]
MNEKGILIILSGFAGSGKGTIIKELMKKYDNYALSVSATTRAPREGEVEGVHYFFKTEDEFKKMIEKGELLEYADYVGNYYGTPREYVKQQLAAGKDVILEIETEGALNIKREYPDAVLVFVMPPSVEEIHNRLKLRGTETDEVIEKRMKKAGAEITVVDRYDFLMINDVLSESVELFNSIVKGQHMAVSRNRDYINDKKKEFEEYLSRKKEN